MNTIELCPRPVLGPTSRNRLGKPATVVPRYACGAALPDVVERAPVAPAHPLGDGHVGDVEAGAEDDRVDLALDAVGGDDSARA